MSEREATSLERELAQFRLEREKIRAIVGSIGGASSLRRGRTLNWVFLGLIAGIVAFDLLRYAADLPVPVSPLVLVEIGVLLVSVKIVWMIHAQARVEHFQFWILSSLEFRLNEIAQAIKRIESKLG